MMTLLSILSLVPTQLEWLLRLMAGVDCDESIEDYLTASEFRFDEVEHPAPPKVQEVAGEFKKNTKKKWLRSR